MCLTFAWVQRPALANGRKGEKTHAWYAAVAPLDNPEIAVAVIMEAAGGGGAVSGPIARKVMMAYFGKEDKK